MTKSISIPELGKYIYPAFKERIEEILNDKNETILKQVLKNVMNTNINYAMEIVLLNECLQYLHLHGVNVILISGPNKKRLNLKEEPYLFRKISLDDLLKDKSYIEKFYHGDKSLFDYAYDEDAGLLNGNRITTNGIHLMSAWFRSKYVNINTMGERYGVQSIHGKYKNNIYVYGSCLTFGLFTDDRRTFPSILQTLINHSILAGLRVHNLGVKGQNCLLNDLLFVLNTSFKKGDIVILVEKFHDNILKFLKGLNFYPYDFTDYLNLYSIKEYSFLNSTFHCNDRIYRLLANFSFDLIKKNCNLNSNFSSKASQSFSYFNEYDIMKQIDSDSLIDRVFIHDLKERLIKERVSLPPDSIIGSLVLSANPFTWGHAKLVDLVAKECNYFYIFVIEDEHFDIPFDIRFKMVSEYALRYSNCKVISTGNYFGADFLFPEYHDRKKCKNKKINNPVIDTIIFAKHISPILGINRRYLGTEEIDPITKQFNTYLMSVLPRFSIEVKIIPRFTTDIDHAIISGSFVRKIMATKSDLYLLKKYLPPSSIKVLGIFNS